MELEVRQQQQQQQRERETENIQTQISKTPVRNLNTKAQWEHVCVCGFVLHFEMKSSQVTHTHNDGQKIKTGDARLLHPLCVHLRMRQMKNGMCDQKRVQKSIIIVIIRRCRKNGNRDEQSSS